MSHDRITIHLALGRRPDMPSRAGKYPLAAKFFHRGFFMGLTTARKGVVGPWSHKHPHLGDPGPAIGFPRACVPWFDQFLKGIGTGVMAEPMVRAFMQGSAPPSMRYEHHSVLATADRMVGTGAGQACALPG